MNKDLILKIAKEKDLKSFYKKYPTQEAFMKVHGKAFKKAQIGTYIGGQTAAPIKPINYSDLYDQADMTVTGKTKKIRDEEALKKAALPANQQQAKPDSSPLGIAGGIINGLSGIVGDLAKSEGEGAEDAEGMLDMLGDARYGKRITKAQFGNMFTRGFNAGNTQLPSGVGYSPNASNYAQSNIAPSGFQMPNTAQSFASNNPLPASVPNMKLPGTNTGTMDKIGAAVGKYAGPAGEIIGGLQTLKAEKEALQGARQTRQLSDLALRASNSRPEQTERKYVRPEDMVTSGNQVAPTQGTGTNILAEDGASVKGKPKKGKKVDVRKETDVIRIPSNVNAGETNYVRTTKSLKGLGKRDNKLQQDATNDFVDWYSDPETKKRFAKNTGMDPARLQDFLGKALRTPMEEYDSTKVNDYPLDGNAEAVFRSPYYNESVGDKSYPKTGYIMHRPQAGDIPELNSYATNMSSAIQHELAHASGLDNVLGNALFRAMGKKPVTKDQKGNLNYMDRPEELYGHFHEFRTSLGLKPGQKVTREELKKKVEENQRVNSTSRFWQYESNDDKTGEQSDKAIDKIVNAINTVAYNPDSDEDVTYAEDGAEIQNTYAPNTLYDDLGYEPLMDSTKVKQYQDGGTPWGMISDKVTGLGQDLMGGQNAGGRIGKTAGKTIGNMIVPGLGGAIGGFVGGLAGNALDTNAKKMAKEQAATERNMGAMVFGKGAQSIQAQNASYMEDGGYVSNDWTPQVIAKFGDHSPEDVYDFAHEGMDSLRAGGHLRSYTDPSEEAMQTFAMGGELQTHWGGHMEEMSQNPYLPDGGVTYMPHGQSHEESDGNGRTGIGITYGDNPVEVERREPIMKLRDGSTGEDNLVVFGNLEIPKYGVELLGDKKAQGMKFKNYVSDLSKSETKQNKTIQKSADELADFDPIDSFDKLKFAGLQANILGGNMKLKEIAQTKEKAAALQNAINDTAEEFGIEADGLAKGKVKTAKMGGEFTKAQNGKGRLSNKYNVDFTKDSGDKKIGFDAGELQEVVIPARKKSKFKKPVIEDIEMPEHLDNPYAKDDAMPLPDDVLSYVSKLAAVDKPSSKTPFDFNPYITALNALAPYFRPSDAEGLDSNQLLGEMYGLSQNQEEPVQAQQYSPQLATRSRISLQDAMNEITAQTRAAQKMAQGNPATQAMIAAQAYEAINKVKGEEFRMNQAADDQLIAANVATLNDAKLKNLGILDQQYVRQATAKSNTKAVAQAALNSISDKYAKNSLENRTLKTYENMYNYRYDAAGRAINMNPLAQFNTPIVGSTATPKDASGDDLLPIYNTKGDVTGYKVKQDAKSKIKTGKNGSIVKAMRNL